GALHADQSCRQIHIRPLQRDYFATAEPRLAADIKLNRQSRAIKGSVAWPDTTGGHCSRSNWRSFLLTA
ncbi:MAG: hypothetical protein V3S01_07260, partial [Dehalococcoidia bacterium]